MRVPRDPAERFWEKVDKHGPGGCWLWTGTLNWLGYARFFITVAPRTRISMAAHTFAYQQLIGPAPEGLEPDHLCRVRHCVNPAHIEWVTRRENVFRGIGNPTVENTKKTHCPAGHPYDEANTYHRAYDNSRQCRACNRQRAREWQERRRGTAF